jgi:hypothetical protein
MAKAAGVFFYRREAGNNDTSRPPNRRIISRIDKKSVISWAALSSSTSMVQE